MNVVKKVSENIRPEALGAVLCSTDTKNATELGAAVIGVMSEMTSQELAGADALLKAMFGQHFMQAAGAAQEIQRMCDCSEAVAA